MAQALSFLFFSNNFTLHNSLDHLTAEFASLVEPWLEELPRFLKSPLVIFEAPETNTLTPSSRSNNEFQIVCPMPNDRRLPNVLHSLTA